MNTGDFLKATGASTPIVCAGMAFVCDRPALCAAIAGAGGVGALAGTLLPPDLLAERIHAVRQSTSGPFHVNQLANFPHDDHVALLAEERPTAVSFHWGLPADDVLGKLHDAGVPVWIQVGSVDAAIAAVEAGASVVIAQGNEAGGHNYDGPALSTLLADTVSQIGDRAGVLAAGGIATAASVREAIDAGAVGAWIGTRFVATLEANAHPAYQQAILDAEDGQTELSSVFGPENPSFNPMRVIANSPVAEFRGRSGDVPLDRSDMEPVGSTMFGPMKVPVRPFDAFVPVPETTGDVATYPLLAGTGVGSIGSLVSAADAVRCLSAAL